MKTLLSLLFAVFASTAVAADKAGEPCPQPGYLSSQVGGEILYCVDGRWKQVSATNVTLAFQLIEGDKLTSGTVTTLAGQPAPISIGNERHYLAGAKKEGDKVVLIPGVVKEGFFMTMTPTLTKDGKIDVEFVASKSDVIAIRNVKLGDDLEVQLPEVRTDTLKQKLTLESGKEVAVPFGPLVEPMESAEVGKPVRLQYTLKLVATKG